MIYEDPQLLAEDCTVLEMIQSQRTRLRTSTQQSPRKWIGTLRRTAMARAIRGSNGIEGIHSSMDDAVAAVDDEYPMDEPTENWFAIRGYRQALTCILQSAKELSFEHSKQFLKALHFMITSHDMARSDSGQYRPGNINVVNLATNEEVYAAPDVEHVDELMNALIVYLRDKENKALGVRWRIST
jgi:Fic family protein